MAGSAVLEWGITAVFAVSGLLLGVLTYVVHNYRDARGTRHFTVLLTVMCVWSLSAAVKLPAPRPVEYLLVTLEIVYGVVFALAFFVFAAAYTGRNWHRTRPFVAIAGTMITVTLVGLATNPVWQLLWRDIVVLEAGFPHLGHEGKGPLYYALVAVSYGLALVGLSFLLDLHLRSRYRTSTLLLVVVGGMMPIVANLVSLRDAALVPGLDYTPFGLAVFGLATTAAINRELFGIVPVARDTAVEYSSEGMVILDARRRIRDANPTAVELVPDLAANEGTPVTDVVPWGRLRFDETDASRTEVVVQHDGEERHLAVRVAPISTGVHHLGWTMALTDITDQKRRERHLDLVARVLRHNMSNQISIVQGQAEVLRDHVDEAGIDHVESILTSSNRIVETSEKLRTLQEIVTDDRGRFPTNLGRSIARVVERLESEYPAGTIEYEAPDVWVECRIGLVAALRNLVENALKHNDTRQPRVSIAVRSSARTVTVSVSDNGPGLPDTERRILGEGETPLQHGSGVGLWLVYWFVELSGGSLTFETPESGGSTVALTLERSDNPSE